jgi:hypothetical protein
VPSFRTLALGAVAGIVLVAATAVGTNHIRTEVRALDDVDASLATVETVDGFAVKGKFGTTGARFFAHVRDTVPAHARIRLVLPLRDPPNPPSPRCGTPFSAPAFWWTAYNLLPRPVYCDGTPRYWVYVGVDPKTVPPPRGAKVDTYAPGFAVATLP